MSGFLSFLPNGVGVLTIPMRERHSVSVAIWIRAGARFETKRSNGISHLLEHMLFKGTKHRNTRQIKEEIEGIGGIVNAFTGEEVTCYFAKLLQEYYPRAMDVLSDMVNHAILDAQELEKERTVILEEIKMYRDLPSHFVHELIGELLWPEQPLGRPISGTEKSVSDISHADLLTYKKRFYHPKNILISVAGPVEHADIVVRTKEYFIRKSYLPKLKFSRAISRQSQPKTLFVEKEMEQTHFVIGMHGFSRFHPGRYKLALLNIILGGNMSSRLFEEVREKRGLAYEIRSGGSFHHDAGALTIAAGVDSGKLPAAMNVILNELRKLSRRPVKEDELRRAKDYFKGQLSLALEDTLEHMLWAGERVMDRGEIPDREKISRDIEVVTTRDVQKIAQRLFRTNNLSLALIGPVPAKIQKRIRRDFEV